MKIDRQNIIELIGKNRNKYSSCVICSYTFDFTFFEERLLAQLRLANIKNINVFVDGNYLNSSLEKNSTAAFRNHHSYSLNQVFSKGIFHPKIMFLTGPRHGLLIIGSGNLTSSGISTNDEIWGAFHMNSLESTNAPLFAEVWAYLESIFPNALGFNRQKIDWIYQRATWVNELKDLRNPNFTPLEGEREIAFVSNQSSSTFERLQALLPKSTLEELNIISPYIDSKTEGISELDNHFQPDAINVISDSEFGLLPTELPTNLTSKINFYDWSDCLENFERRFNRLHAKVFQFRYSNGEEYLLIGSANATIAALGGAKRAPKNAEAGLLIKTNSSVNTMEQFGIAWQNATPLDLSAISRRSPTKGDSPFNSKASIIINHAEINGASLEIIISKISKSKIETTVVVEDSFGNRIQELVINELAHSIKMDLTFPERTAIVYLKQRQELVSNKCMIHLVNVLAKCNPDPTQERLNETIANLENNPEGDEYIELLKYADYNWVEDELEEKLSSNGQANSARPRMEKVRQHVPINAEEFESLDSVQNKEQRILNDPINQVADILSIISTGIKTEQETYTESTEELLISQDEEERTGEGEAVNYTVVRIRGEQLKSSISGYFKKVHTRFNTSLKPLSKNRSSNSAPTTPITFKASSQISILFDLLYLFHQKAYVGLKTEFAIRFDKDKGIEAKKANEKDKVKRIEKLRSLEKRFKLERSGKRHASFKNAVFYLVEQDSFPELIQAFEKELPGFLISQPEYLSHEYKVKFLIDGAYNVEHSSGVKTVLIETLGSFLLNCNKKAGFKEYQYTALNDRLKEYRTNIAEKAIFLLCNLHWSEKELVYLILLALNVLNSIYPLDFTPEKIVDRIHYWKANANNINLHFENNLQYLIDYCVKPLLEWQKVFTQSKTDLLKLCNQLSIGDIIYSTNLGFGSVVRHYGSELTLILPGLEWHETTAYPSLKLIYPQEKIIAFS